MSDKPSFLLEKPEPHVINILHDHQPIKFWKGKMKFSDVKGWAENPRIELKRKELLTTIGNRPLSQDEIFEIMTTDEKEFKLKHLRDDIIKNGLRKPLKLTFEGELLDGNRRFFAMQLASRDKNIDSHELKKIEEVEVFVLTKDSTQDDKQTVLVEENFTASHKIEWPDYVLAQKIIEARDDYNMDKKEISKKYRWSVSKIVDTFKIMEIIYEFLSYAVELENPNDESGGGLGLSDIEAESIASKNYQFFNEAKKSFYEQLQNNYEFKIQFFKWIYENKFHSFPEVRRAYDAWNNPDAKKILLTNDKGAAKKAKALLDYESFINPSTEDAARTIEKFIKFLNSMRTAEIKNINELSRKNLENSLRLVIQMSGAVSNEPHESQD